MTIFIKYAYNKKGEMMKIIDLHCDSVMKLMKSNETLYNKKGHINLKKLKKGHYMLQCFAMFVNLKKTRNPYLYCKEMIEKYYQNINKYSHIIKPAYNYQDIIENDQNNLISALLTIEEGGVLQGDIKKLKEFYQLGVRMITLTWNYPNEIGYPNIDNYKINQNTTNEEIKTMIETKNGLTEKGIEIIKEMEKLKMIIDVSHLSDKGLIDVLKNTTKPFVASHSNARSICNHPRNISDELLIELKKRKCLIGINYCPNFLKENSDKMKINDVIKHIKYLKNLIGIDYIALGSDFDGISGKLELKDASHLPKLIKKLKQNGFNDEEINKITHQNALRLFKEVLYG